MSQTKYVRRSLQALSVGLGRLGHSASPDTVADLLRDLDYNLHVNIKHFTGPVHPDRDRPFRYLQEMVACFSAEGWLILSVDTKKKERVGNFENPGAIWCRHGEEVNAHDFLQDAECRAVPYGLYDYLANRGHVVVGTSADTPAFAVDAIAHLWGRIGSKRYPQAGALLILADAWAATAAGPGCGKSNSRRRWQIATVWS
jgi:hypothetical protein